MSAQWLNHSNDVSTRISTAVSPLLQHLSQPAQLQRIRRILAVLLLLWALFAVVKLVWALVPQPEQAASAPAAVINPVTEEQSRAASRNIDIEAVRGWHLFGEAGAAEVIQPEPAVASARDGIEEGARETRLSLVLRGIVASTEDGLGHAIIEHRSKQAIYTVEDKLPVSGRVILAKVMPRQVILDNGGTYERLELFDDSEFSGTVPASVPKQKPKEPAEKEASDLIDKRTDSTASELAGEFHSRLYEDPQSLAEVVSVSAVRGRGYRLSPGGNPEQFEQLGFKTGDVVTSINGVELNSPANTMKLYTMLREVDEITFELVRNDQPYTLTVSVGQLGQ